eukprot:Pgem_evm3s11358
MDLTLFGSYFDFRLSFGFSDFGKTVRERFAKPPTPSDKKVKKPQKLVALAQTSLRFRRFSDPL